MDWKAFSLADILQLLDGFDRWFLDGGAALDHFLGRSSRTHGDIDIGVLSPDVEALLTLFIKRGLEVFDACHELQRVKSPGSSKKSYNYWIADGKHYKVQVLVYEAEKNLVAFRRNPAMKWPLEAFALNVNGVRVVNPLVIYAFKVTTRSPEPKDLTDVASLLRLVSSYHNAALTLSMDSCNSRQTYVCKGIKTETEYLIDSESLHPVAVDGPYMLKVAEELEQAAENADDLKTKADLAGKAGWCFAVLTMHDRAARLVEMVRSNLTLINDLNSRLTSEIRLAQIYQLSGNLQTALELLTAAENVCLKNAEAASMLDFVLQHKGKVYYDQKDYSKAVQCFEIALKLRVQKNNSELLESSVQAIEVCKKRLNNVIR
ncbi:MAG: hypothetical protein AB1403_18720 [Candidatus Riflebacteria bacterium]